MASPTNSEALLNIQMVSVVHPDSKASFKGIAASKQSIREGRSNIAAACTQCTKYPEDGKELQKCAKCKIARYCSRECQKTHWPVHKKVCKDESSNVPKLLNSFAVNPVLNHFLQIAFVLSFDLNKKPIMDTPIIARCDVSVEPADMSYIMRLVMGQLPPTERAKGTPGMLQVRTFVPLDAATAVDRARMEVWKNMKRRNAERGLARKSVALVDFHMKGTVQSITLGIVILDDAILRVNSGEGYVLESALMGRTEMALSPQSCLDFINTHIRADKRNQLRLRTHMTQEDIEKYRNSGNDDADKKESTQCTFRDSLSLCCKSTV